MLGSRSKGNDKLSIQLFDVLLSPGFVFTYHPVYPIINDGW